MTSLVFCPPSSGHSLQLLTASSSVRKLLPTTHGLPKNGLCKLIPEGEWQRVPVGRGAASAGTGAGAGHHHSGPDPPPSPEAPASPSMEEYKVLPLLRKT